MFFCPNCDNIYSITKNAPSVQSGGKKNDDSDSDTPMTVSASDSYTISHNNSNDIVTQILQTGTYEGKVDMKFIDDVLKMPSYRKLSSKDKVFVKNKLMEQLPQEDKIKMMEATSVKPTSSAYFICKKCGTSEPIKSKTLVMSKLSAEGNHDFIDNTNYKNMVHVKTLPLTRNYVCPNDKCISHK